ATLVLKRGAQGCAVFPGPIPKRIEYGILHAGFRTEVFNVLGAGDGFMAGLLRGWLRDENWQKATAYANACGALVVSRHGCAPAMPSAIELEELLTRIGDSHRLHLDTHFTRLHSATTGRPLPKRVFALAFDHRRQFSELAEAHGASEVQIRNFKH